MQTLAMDPPGSSQWMDAIEPETEAAMLNRHAGWASSGGSHAVRRGRCRRGVLVLALGAFQACTVLPVGWTGRQGGLASWYGPGFYGRRTASGAVYTGAALTAAHRSLPFGTLVQVTNLANGRTVVVVIDDRGPFVRGRVIDLSAAAARRLGMIRAGVVPVRLEVVG